MGSDLVDTLSSDNKGDFGLGSNEEVTVVSGDSLLVDQSQFFGFISFEIFLGFVFPFLSSGFNESFLLGSLLDQQGGFLVVSFLLLGKGLGDETILLC